MPFFGEFCALVTALLWSGSTLTFSKAANRIGSINLNISRLILAEIILFLTVLVLNLESSINLNQIFFLSLSGFLGLTFGDSFLFRSYKYQSPRISSLIMSLSPAITSIIAFFFLNEKLAIIAIIGIIVTLFGIGIVILERKNGDPNDSRFNIYGVLYAFLGAIGQSGGIIFAKLAFMQGNINSIIATLIRITAGIIFIVPISIFFKRFKNPIKIFKNDKKALMYTVFGTFLGPVFGITFSMISIMYAETGIASTLMATAPIPLLIMLRIIEKEIISWKAIIGTIIAISGVALIFLH